MTEGFSRLNLDIKIYHKERQTDRQRQRMTERQTKSKTDSVRN